MANLLAQETSPYLLQHKDNPVHWRAWGPDAFDEARRRDVPILLSVGYAACHWCHVMAHESFEDEGTAARMNEGFVNVKVDREERPDVDAIYQAALAMMGEHGGWPLTMFLTPEGAPFWGGTYFPPESRYGRPAFRDVLGGVSQAYIGQRDKVEANVTALTGGLARLNHPPPPEGLSLELLDAGARQVVQMMDAAEGGLAGAPKFPQPQLFAFLWRAWRRTGAAEMGDAVLLTLDRMCQGGIYDHLGGGFARYSTDEHWLAPHFEKMLYDNAQLVDLLTQAWRHTRSPLYAQRIAETVEWMLREMIAEQGAFAATLDADSEGEEGRFYVWTEAQIDALLPADQAAAFKKVYDVRPGGNWEGKTILHRNHRHGGKADEAALSEMRAGLLLARERRVRPGRDDKVLADWNGLMIAGLAEAAFTFDQPRWLAAAVTAFDAVCGLLLRGDRLGHAYRQGRRLETAVLDDYAAMARAASTLFEITGQPHYLGTAASLVAAADRHYADPEGGYFFTADDAGDLIVRTKSALDSATPSGNGMMAEVLVKLHHMTGEAAYRDRAERLIAAFSGLVRHQLIGLPTLLNAFETLAAPMQVVIVGPPDTAETEALIRAVAETDIPTRILLRLRPGESLPPDHPAAGKGLVEGRPAAYVCIGPTCSLPATTADELRERLAAR